MNSISPRTLLSTKVVQCHNVIYYMLMRFFFMHVCFFRKIEYSSNSQTVPEIKKSIEQGVPSNCRSSSPILLRKQVAYPQLDKAYPGCLGACPQRNDRKAFRFSGKKKPVGVFSLFLGASTQTSWVGFADSWVKKSSAKQNKHFCFFSWARKKSAN